MNSGQPAKHFKFWSNPVFKRAVVVALVLILFLGKAFNIDLDGLLRFSDRLAAFPTIEANYKQIYDKASSNRSDVWLKAPSDEDSPLELARGQYYGGCIRGGFTHTFGTNRAYQDILDDYRDAFSEMDWKDSSDDSGASNKTTSISIHRIVPTSREYAIGADKYRTLYTVSLIYADPEVYTCYG